MAEKRMFKKQICQSGKYVGLSHGAQSLYFFINLNADDDGFLPDGTIPMMFSKTNETHLQELIDAGFILQFQSGVLAVRHFNLHNTLKKDRYHSTIYAEERRQVFIDDNGIMAFIPDGTRAEPERNPNGNTMEPQYSVAKRSLAELSVTQPSVAYSSLTEPREGERRGGTLLFEKLYNAYPNHTGKRESEQQLFESKNLDSDTVELMLSAIEKGKGNNTKFPSLYEWLCRNVWEKA